MSSSDFHSPVKYKDVISGETNEEEAGEEVARGQGERSTVEELKREGRENASPPIA